jgi:hypothetical protein
VARMGKKRNVFRVLVGNLKAKKESETPRHWWKMILTRMVKKQGEMARISFSWLFWSRYWYFGFHKMLTVFWLEIVSFSRRFAAWDFPFVCVYVCLLFGWLIVSSFDQSVCYSVGWLFGRSII